MDQVCYSVFVEVVHSAGIDKTAEWYRCVLASVGVMCHTGYKQDHRMVQVCFRGFGCGGCTILPRQKTRAMDQCIQDKGCAFER